MKFSGNPWHLPSSARPVRWKKLEKDSYCDGLTSLLSRAMCRRSPPPALRCTTMLRLKSLQVQVTGLSKNRCSHLSRSSRCHVSLYICWRPLAAPAGGTSCPRSASGIVLAASPRLKACSANRKYNVFLYSAGDTCPRLSRPCVLLQIPKTWASLALGQVSQALWYLAGSS